ncbi:hypothetical protein, partial [Escherichia coli]|uniref:hypothetical protein n=1 Tax=Escherichia coli TaxID=562 RepID=UPI001AA11475
THYDASLSADLRRALGAGPGGKIPSAGIAAIWWAVYSRLFAGHAIHALGFGWQGWTGHAFDEEARVARDLTERGALTPLTLEA